MRITAPDLGVALALGAASCSPSPPEAPRVSDASTIPVGPEILAGQSPRVEAVGAISIEQSERLTQQVEEVDRRYNYYRSVGESSRRFIGRVDLHHPVTLAVAGRAGRCHRVSFVAEGATITLTLRNNAFVQGPTSGVLGSLGQYRQICPTTSVVYRLEVATASAAPVAFAVDHVEFQR